MLQLIVIIELINYFRNYTIARIIKKSYMYMVITLIISIARTIKKSYMYMVITLIISIARTIKKSYMYMVITLITLITLIG